MARGKRLGALFSYLQPLRQVNASRINLLKTALNANIFSYDPGLNTLITPLIRKHRRTIAGLDRQQPISPMRTTVRMQVTMQHARRYVPKTQNTPLGFPSGVLHIVKLETAYRAFLATSTIAVKAAGSLIAMSESTLRSSSTPAFFRPFMKAE